MRKIATVLIPLSVFIMAVDKCDPAGERPRWRAQFWAGNAADQSINRYQTGDLVYCSDERFDEFVCLSYDDLEKLEEEVLSRCAVWKK